MSRMMQIIVYCNANTAATPRHIQINLFKGMGFLIFCHSYGGSLSIYQLWNGNYKKVPENISSPNILPFWLTWQARLGSQRGNGELTREDRRQKTSMPPAFSHLMRIVSLPSAQSHPLPSPFIPRAAAVGARGGLA